MIDKLLEQISNLPMGDMENYELSILCGSNGKGPTWIVTYTHASPNGSNKITLTDEYIENHEFKGLEQLLNTLLEQLKK